MIEAQLQAIRKYPESNLRRQHVESELIKDLEYVSNNMKEDPKVVLHRERMRDMHVDFFSLLKWQRERLIKLPWDEPKYITGMSPCCYFIAGLHTGIPGVTLLSLSPKARQGARFSVSHLLVPLLGFPPFALFCCFFFLLFFALFSFLTKLWFFF